MKDRIKAVFASLSPTTREVIVGFGMAFDPAPRTRFKAFCTSDAAAFYMDGRALYSDWCVVRDHRLPPSLASRSMEADHIWGARSARPNVSVHAERRQYREFA